VRLQPQGRPLRQPPGLQLQPRAQAPQPASVQPLGLARRRLRQPVLALLLPLGQVLALQPGQPVRRSTGRRSVLRELHARPGLLLRLPELLQPLRLLAEAQPLEPVQRQPLRFLAVHREPGQLPLPEPLGLRQGLWLQRLALQQPALRPLGFRRLALLRQQCLRRQR